jgi:regulator of nucleoside diphosphate kinase
LRAGVVKTVGSASDHPREDVFFNGRTQVIPAANEVLDHDPGSRLLRRPPIVLTSWDRDNLMALLRTASAAMDPRVACFLREELERADIACRAVSSTAVVSIGSTVKFIDHNATNSRQVKLVLPDEANDVDFISVTAALGSALIGLGPGQTISWHDGQSEPRTTVLEISKSADLALACNAFGEKPKG